MRTLTIALRSHGQSPTLISVSPAKYIYIREGLSASPIGVLGVLAPATNETMQQKGPKLPGPLPFLLGPNGTLPAPP
jgi:hypothetical protein